MTSANTEEGASPLTYDSEVLVEQSHIDRQQLRQSDGQTAAQTNIRISRVHDVQHCQKYRDGERYKERRSRSILPLHFVISNVIFFSTL